MAVEHGSLPLTTPDRPHTPPSITPERDRTVTLDGNAFLVRYPMDEILNARLRNIDGTWWDKGANAWRVPVNQADQLAPTIKGKGFYPDTESKTLLLPYRDVDSQNETVTEPLSQVPPPPKEEPEHRYNRSAPLDPGPPSPLSDSAELALEASRALDADLVVPGLNPEMTLRPFQKAGIAYAVSKRRTFLADEVGLGKALAADTNVLTPHGWKPIKDVAVGDKVIGSNGQPTTVLGVYPQGKRDLYRVAFTDNTSVLCDDEHLWSVKSGNDMTRGNDWRVVSVKELRNTQLEKKPYGSNWRIPMLSAPVEFSSNKTFLDPYLMGLLLGDGSFLRGTTRFSSGDIELVDAVEKIVPEPVYVTRWQHPERTHTECYLSTASGLPNPVRDHLEEMGLWGKRSEEKWVPQEYLFSSPEDRLSLLRGLMDTDGYVAKDNCTQFYSSSKQLAEDVIFLVQSLGGVARLNLKEEPTYTNKGEKLIGLPAWRVTVQMPGDMNPFTLKRKAEAWKPRPKYQPQRAIKSIEFEKLDDAVCIAVDADDKLFVTEHCLVTHNTILALATVAVTGSKPVVVICQKSLKLNWVAEVHKWFPKWTVTVVDGRNPEPIEPADVIIVNYDILGKVESRKKKGGGSTKESPGRLPDILALDPQAMIVDESHRIKEAKAARSKAVRQLSSYIGDDGVILLLSATPMLNRVREYIHQLQVLRRLDTEFGGWNFFVRRWCAAKKEYGRWNLDGSSHELELHERLRASCYVRRTKNDVLPELPPVTWSDVHLPLSPSGEKEYRKAEEDIVKYLAEKAAAIARELGENPNSAAVRARMRAQANEDLVRLNALRLLAAQAKLPALIEWVESFLEETQVTEVDRMVNPDARSEKLILFAHHREIQQTLRDHFKALSIESGQDMSLEEIEENKRLFQESEHPDHRIIVCSGAAKEGHTLTRASNVAIAEPVWVPGDEIQMVGRCVAEGSLVHTYRGLVPIEDIVVGDKVLTHAQRWQPVTNTYSRPAEELLEFDVARSVDPLRVTPDHPLYAKHMVTGEIDWVRADEITPDHLLAFPRIIGDELKTLVIDDRNVEVTSELLSAFGKWLDVGSLNTTKNSHDTVVLSGHVNDSPDLRKALETIRSAFNVESTLDERVLGDSYTVQLNSTKIASSFHDWFFAEADVESQSNTKRLAPWMLSLSNTQTSAVLSGLYSADNQSFFIPSPHLARQLALLTAQIGLNPKITRVDEGYEVNVEQNNDCSSKQHVWSPVSSIRTIGATQVYDLTVAQDHSFVVESSVVHNCWGRLNDPHGATLFRFIGEDTTDEKMVELVARKREISDAVMDGKPLPDIAYESVMDELIGSLVFEDGYDGVGPLENE